MSLRADIQVARDGVQDARNLLRGLIHRLEVVAIHLYRDGRRRAGQNFLDSFGQKRHDLEGKAEERVERLLDISLRLFSVLRSHALEIDF